MERYICIRVCGLYIRQKVEEDMKIEDDDDDMMFKPHTLFELQNVRERIIIN